MTKCLVDRSTEIGRTLVREKVVGAHLPDPFLDSFYEEMLCCHAIIEYVEHLGTSSVTMEFDKDFLKKIVRHHIYFIQDLETKGFNANRYPAPRKDRNTL